MTTLWQRLHAADPALPEPSYGPEHMDGGDLYRRAAWDTNRHDGEKYHPLGGERVYVTDDGDNTLLCIVTGRDYGCVFNGRRRHWREPVELARFEYDLTLPAACARLRALLGMPPKEGSDV